MHVVTYVAVAVLLMQRQAPDQFGWRAGRDYVTTTKPGLYQVCMAFFAPTPPHVTLFVNDSAALSNPPVYVRKQC